MIVFKFAASRRAKHGLQDFISSQATSSMAAYAALVSLAQTTHLSSYQDSNLFFMEAEEKIRSIHEYVLYLLSFLEDYPKKSQRWEKRIRELSHEAEDFIEDFMWIRNRKRYEERALPNLEEQLQNVTEKLGLIAGELMDERPSDLPNVVPSSTSSSPSRLAPTGNNAVIGLDEDLTTIRGRLCGEPSDLHIIPIVGMGGIGKTTLARTVYSDSSILLHFDFRVWITVSQDYTSHSLRKILLDLLESMNLLEKLVLGKKLDVSEGRGDMYKKLEKVDVCEMTTLVFQNLKCRRYLIIMDDVWSTEVCDDIWNIFPDDCNGSRVMVTTRLLDVATYCRSPLHDVQVLNDAQSWDLLEQKVFANNNCPPHLEDVGKEIAQKCAGLPLAVVLVAGLLFAVNADQASWEEIARNLVTTGDLELDEILSLSYTHLPYHLRPCFLYLGGFPEDENIHASRLIKLWEAESFLKYEYKCDKSLEEEAEEYLEDLVKRNLVHVNSRKISGKIKSCSLHDMVRDMCIRKALEEKFLCVIDRSDNLQYLIDERRFSLRLSDIDSLLAPTLRTILSFNPYYFSLLLSFLGCFRLLRVLHDASVNQKELSSQIFELFHLRYLALNGMNITSAISKLVNLETLIIHPTFLQYKRKWRDDRKYSSQFALPLEIWSMQRLKHLIVYDAYTLPHPEESHLPSINLQTLSLVGNLVWNEKMVEMIPNVKRLGLVYTAHQEYNIHHLKDLLQLEKLHLSVSFDLFWAGEVPNFPTTLKKLTLDGGGIPWADMSIIGSLPNLQVLKLLDYACLGDTWEITDDEFHQLRYLLIETSSLQQWIMQSSSFPRLERLVLRFCWDLLTIPEDIGEIPTLVLIEVTDCSNSALMSAKEIRVYQQSCGNDALQVHCVRSGKTRLSRFSKMVELIRPDHEIDEAVLKQKIEDMQTELRGQMYAQLEARLLAHKPARKQALKQLYEQDYNEWEQEYSQRFEAWLQERQHLCEGRKERELRRHHLLEGYKEWELRRQQLYEEWEHNYQQRWRSDANVTSSTSSSCSSPLSLHDIS